MQIKKLLLALVLPFTLLGCPDKATPKPDPVTAAPPGKAPTTPAATAAPAASAKSGSGW
jgi:hypothetical protein